MTWRAAFAVLLVILLSGCSFVEERTYKAFPRDCFSGAEKVLAELVRVGSDPNVHNSGSMTLPYPNEATRTCRRHIYQYASADKGGSWDLLVEVDYFKPEVSREYDDPVAAARESLGQLRRSPESKRPLLVREEGISWNTAATTAVKGGGHAAFRDSNLVVYVSVTGVDFGDDLRERPLDPVKVEQDAVKILQAIKEAL